MSCCEDLDIEVCCRPVVWLSNVENFSYINLPGIEPCNVQEECQKRFPPGSKIRVTVTNKLILANLANGIGTCRCEKKKKHHHCDC